MHKVEHTISYVWYPGNWYAQNVTKEDTILYYKLQQLVILTKIYFTNGATNSGSVDSSNEIKTMFYQDETNKLKGDSHEH